MTEYRENNIDIVFFSIRVEKLKNSLYCMNSIQILILQIYLKYLQIYFIIYQKSNICENFKYNIC